MQSRTSGGGDGCGAKILQKLNRSRCDLTIPVWPSAFVSRQADISTKEFVLPEGHKMCSEILLEN